jgi:hypothetical protein
MRSGLLVAARTKTPSRDSTPTQSQDTSRVEKKRNSAKKMLIKLPTARKNWLTQKNSEPKKRTHHRALKNKNSVPSSVVTNWLARKKNSES